MLRFYKKEKEAQTLGKTVEYKKGGQRLFGGKGVLRFPASDARNAANDRCSSPVVIKVLYILTFWFMFEGSIFKFPAKIR